MKVKPYLKIALIAAITVGIATGAYAESLTSKANKAKEEFLKQDASLKDVFDKAVGYVIFPSVAKGALGIGAAKGKGELFEKGKDKPAGEAKLTQVTIGFQAGGQAYAELILFQDQTSMDNFKKGNFEFSAQASAVAVTAGAAANAKYENGIMILTMAKGGLMYEASVGGQKFKYKAY